MDELINDINNNQTDLYKVKIEAFEGPFDLLLHLIKTAEIDIYDIPIAEITNQYLTYLSFLVALDLDNISEFVEMASTLILIKSRAMLPVKIDYDEEQTDPREELIAKLLEYQKYKIAAGLLETKVDDSIPMVKKNNDKNLFQTDENKDSNWKQLSVLDLIGAFADVLNKNKEVDTALEVLLYNFTVDEKIEHITNVLKDKESINYFDLIEPIMPKLELVCTFLALLELVKKGTIFVRQHIIFGDIHIVRRNESVAEVTNQELHQ